MICYYTIITITISTITVTITIIDHANVKQMWSVRRFKRDLVIIGVLIVIVLAIVATIIL